MASNNDYSPDLGETGLEDQMTTLQTDDRVDHKLDELKTKLQPYLESDRLIKEIPLVVMTKVINPLDYARELYVEYLTKKPQKTTILFVGMNPSTESLTGIPFYDVEMWNDLIGEDRCKKNFKEIKERFPDGDLQNKKGSGPRFWDYMKEKFILRKAFFKQCFVINYCPLIFVDQRDRNISMSHGDFKKHEPLNSLMANCDEALKNFIQAENPELVVGIGWYAFARITEAIKNLEKQKGSPSGVKTLQIAHPSSKTVTEEKWNNKVEDSLGQNEVWKRVVAQDKVQVAQDKVQADKDVILEKGNSSK